MAAPPPQPASATAAPPLASAALATTTKVTAASPTKPAAKVSQPASAKALEKAKKEKPAKKGSEPVVAKKKPIKTVEDAFKASAVDRDYRAPYAGPKFIIKQAGNSISHLFHINNLEENIYMYLHGSYSL